MKKNTVLFSDMRQTDYEIGRVKASLHPDAPPEFDEVREDLAMLGLKPNAIKEYMEEEFPESKSPDGTYKQIDLKKILEGDVLYSQSTESSEVIEEPPNLFD